MKAKVFVTPKAGKWARPLPTSPSRRRRLSGSLRSKSTAALLALLAVVLPADAAAAPLGRLFFTPERRAEFEGRRHVQRRETKQDRAGGSMRLDGIVVSRGGAATVWVDGKAQRRRADAMAPAAATLAIGDGAQVQLRVGEAIDRGTSKRTDVVAAEAIRIAGRPAHGR